MSGCPLRPCWSVGAVAVIPDERVLTSLTELDVSTGTTGDRIVSRDPPLNRVSSKTHRFMDVVARSRQRWSAGVVVGCGVIVSAMAPPLIVNGTAKICVEQFRRSKMSPHRCPGDDQRSRLGGDDRYLFKRRTA